MPPRSASQAETYSPYLTDPNSADSAVEVKQNLTDDPRPVKERNAARDRMLAEAARRGWSLFLACELRQPHGGQP